MSNTWQQRQGENILLTGRETLNMGISLSGGRQYSHSNTNTKSSSCTDKKWIMGLIILVIINERTSYRTSNNNCSSGCWTGTWMDGTAGCLQPQIQTLQLQSQKRLQKMIGEGRESTRLREREEVELVNVSNSSGGEDSKIAQLTHM